MATGVFGAHMEIALVNDGPVTIWLDSRARGVAGSARAQSLALRAIDAEAARTEGCDHQQAADDRDVLEEE